MKDVTLQTQFKLLLGDDKEMEEVMRKKNIRGTKMDFNSIKRQVMNFNPFKNRHSFYFNPGLTSVVRIFDFRLKRYGNKIKGKDDEWNNSFKIKAASTMLSCNIIVYETDSVRCKKSPNYIPSELSNNDTIVIFQHKGVQRQDRVIEKIGFGMSLIHADHLRRDALTYILGKTELEVSKIRNIKHNYKYDDNFLLFLLKNSWQCVIPFIYKSSYISLKLKDAGFNTDPFRQDENGLSAFYYCLLLNETLPLSILYDYASNNFQQSEQTVRNPGAEILTVLKNTQERIKSDFANSICFGTWTDRSKITYSGLLRFNDYQRCLLREICHILSNSNAVATEHKNNSAIAILNLYPTYFYHDVSSSDDDDLFQNYLKYSDYYENMDNFTCLLFFDSFLHLELLPDSDPFLDAVLSIFRTVLGYKYFPSCVHTKNCSPCDFSGNLCGLRFIPYCDRKLFLQNAKSLCNQIASIDNSKQKPSEQKQNAKSDRKIKDMVQIIRTGLKRIPEINDEFVVFRLKRYLTVASEVSLENCEIKAVLTIERSLQVIGEALCTSTGSNSVIGYLLCSCLPPNLEDQLINIRNNYLSHYRVNEMHYRLASQKNIQLFQNIQNELKLLHNIFQCVYDSQSFRVMESMIETGKRESKVLSNDLPRKIEEIHNQITDWKNIQYNKNRDKYILLASNMLNYLHGSIKTVERKKDEQLEGKIDALNFSFLLISQEWDSDSKQRWQNAYHAMRDIIITKKHIAKKRYDFTQQERSDLLKHFSIHHNIMNSLFADLNLPNYLTSFPTLTRFGNDGKISWFTPKELCVILDKVKEQLNKSEKAIKTLKDKQPLTVQEINKLLHDIYTSEKNKEYIRKYFNIDHQKILNTVANVYSSNQVTNEEDLRIFLETEGGRNLLFKTILPDELEKKVFNYMNRKLECLLDRIGHMKTILIEDDREIMDIWEWGSSPEVKRHMKFLMRKRFMNETDVRASLEMLLFDCSNILKSEDLKNLWTKASKLFTGANLRDVLSHGNTILQTAGDALDKGDLPSEFIDKMLELIEDNEALRAISTLWEKLKPKNKEELSSVIDIMDGEDVSLKDKIKQCSRREQYMRLLPLQW